MKSSIGALLVLSIAVASPVFAQDSSAKVTGTVQSGNTTIVFTRSNAGLNMEQLNAFGQVLASDPALANKLAKSPSLVANSGFVSQHPALQEYLEKYPQARADIQVNPGNYLEPTNGSNWNHAAPGLKGTN